MFHTSFFSVSALACFFVATNAVPACLQKLPGAAAVERALKTPTGNPSNCTAGTKYFPQPIDHQAFNGNWSDENSTFFQQYEIIDTYYKPGGPIFFHQSAESPLECVDDQAIPVWAQELGALVVSAEHRYFGLSCPYNLNYSQAADWDPQLLRPLTLRNILADGISLLEWIKSVKYPAAKHAKVIVFGGKQKKSFVRIFSNRPNRILWRVSFCIIPCPIS